MNHFFSLEHLFVFLETHFVKLYSRLFFSFYRWIKHLKTVVLNSVECVGDGLCPLSIEMKWSCDLSKKWQYLEVFFNSLFGPSNPNIISPIPTPCGQGTRAKGSHAALCLWRGPWHWVQGAEICSWDSL